ncbi:inositol monophosphatase family protein [Peptococcus simiae]|uniref:inositol-phosphate phosphatase n=1 Tax=Peptococcus simiae TaxID=1643805 RepID=A0ABW9GZ59_9FIRM
MSTHPDLPALVRDVAACVRDIGCQLWGWEIESVDYKGNDPQDLVSNLDRRVQAALATRLQALCPAGFYAEEKDNRPIEGLTWIVDPIDGTTNFVSRKRDFAISVALYDGSEPLLGVVFDVERGDLYSAIKGGGAYLNGLALDRPVDRPLPACILEMSIGTLRNLMRRTDAGLLNISREVRATRAMGCGSLAICQIATGRTQLYLSSRLRPWDHAAARVILEELGGVLVPLFPSAQPGVDPFLSGAPLPLLCAASQALADDIIHRYFSPVKDN